MKLKQIQLSLFILVLSTFGCLQNDQHQDNATNESNLDADGMAEGQNDLFYHYSIWWAFVNRVFEGDLDAAHLKTKGNIGLGSYNQLDGELIMLDGVLYQAKQDGTVLQPSDDIKIAYANAAFFKADQEFVLKDIKNYDQLRDEINSRLPSGNYFYGFRIHGQFKKMTCGGLHKQEKPYTKGLDTLIPTRPKFFKENVSGTMVGFYCPEFIGNINVSGYHLHFVSDDKSFAGHVMEFEAESVNVAFDLMKSYQFVLPETAAFEEVGFDKEFQYKKR